MQYAQLIKNHITHDLRVMPGRRGGELSRAGLMPGSGQIGARGVGTESDRHRPRGRRRRGRTGVV
jgi:hypothetical protein